MKMVGRLRSTAIVLTLLIGLSGCAGTPMTDRLVGSPPSGMAERTEIADVPFFAQTEFHCGPAALATALNHTGLETEPGDLAKAIYTPGRKGTLQTEILTGTRRNGRLALPVAGMEDAFDKVAEGYPVLILQNLGLEIAPQWHYAVLVGYDLNAEQVFLRSGTTRRLAMDMDTFEHTWRRANFWGQIIAKPEGPVPDDTEMPDWLSAAVGMQRAGRLQDAETAFRTASTQWTDRAAPEVSLAYLQIRDNRLEDARRTLVAALDKEPGHPVALNNLAHVLMEQGKLQDAEETALKAVEAGGHSADTAKQTLAEIRAELARVSR